MIVIFGYPFINLFVYSLLRLLIVVVIIIVECFLVYFCPLRERKEERKIIKSNEMRIEMLILVTDFYEKV